MEFMIQSLRQVVILCFLCMLLKNFIESCGFAFAEAVMNFVRNYPLSSLAFVFCALVTKNVVMPSLILQKRVHAELDRTMSLIYRDRARSAAIVRCCTSSEAAVSSNNMPVITSSETSPSRTAATKTTTKNKRNEKRPFRKVSIYCQSVSGDSQSSQVLHTTTRGDAAAPVESAASGSTNNNDQDALVLCLTTGSLFTTQFLILPHLPQADHAAFILRKIAAEFQPIVQRRGYSIFKVAEMCCCGDAGETGKSRFRDVTKSDKLGINTTRYLPNGTQTHMIHVRLRNSSNHYQFRPYSEIANTVAHELAHCVYRKHFPRFWKLMADIQQEYMTLISTPGAISYGCTTIDQFDGFDIYGASYSSSNR